MTAIDCLIIDDEPYAVDLMEIYIRDSTNWKILGKSYDAQEALELIRVHQPQLLFLDINMPKLTGLEMADLLPHDIKVVFTTAYSAHAAESYEYQTLDYLLKPILLKRFLATVQKVESYYSKQQSNGPENPHIENAHFYIKSGKTLHKILLADILYFEGQKEYVKLVTIHENLLIYRRLKEIENQLTMPFIRVHNSFIINTRHLVKVLDNHIYLGLIQVPISEKFREGFQKAISQRIF